MPKDNITENSFEDFVKRFEELHEQASQYGLVSISLIMDSNPLDRNEYKEIIYRNGHIASLGLVEWGKYILLNELSHDEKDIEEDNE